MITLLKLGGSVLTDKSKPYTARHGEIKRLSDEVKEALEDIKDLRLIIGNGGGSFPHQPARKGELHKGIKDAWQLEHMVEAHRAAAELNHILVTALVNEGVPAIAVKPSSAAYAIDNDIVDFNILMIEELIKLNAVPVIHGDVLIDLKHGCSIASTETLFRYLARKLDVSRVVVGTNVDGVLDDEGNLIPTISHKTFDSIARHLKGSGNTDVTGGMLHKVETMLDMTGFGREIRIVNALKEGEIKRALEGREVGTLITNHA